jgi:ribosomal protein S27E
MKQRLSHSQIRDAQCISCGKFLSKERILAHQRYVHHVSQEEVSCDDCGKTFPNQVRECVSFPEMLSTKG